MSDLDPWFDARWERDREPLTARTVPVFDGGLCPRHGAYEDPTCVGCPTTGNRVRRARQEAHAKAREARHAEAYAALVEVPGEEPWGAGGRGDSAHHRACVMSAETYGVENGWLVEHVNEHTCGTGRDGYYGAHEPGCGTVPIAPVEQVLQTEPRVRAAAMQEATGWLAGIDTDKLHHLDLTPTEAAQYAKAIDAFRSRAIAAGAKP